uniref:Uncharacterized protein n=1 Tax=Rhizophora mucronata TaxID=61149 RepID=A0A2P2QQ66_RHIMU
MPARSLGPYLQVFTSVVCLRLPFPDVSQPRMAKESCGHFEYAHSLLVSSLLSSLQVSMKLPGNKNFTAPPDFIHQQECNGGEDLSSVVIRRRH